ncbi:heavy metal translocating P-type ATPase [Roseibacterium sp. SDUM158017]|uniref:heavy metal translocating P-type ATPase n=1 Tax=Roseicyclus salinarum TaxID=3036773 RepID=UPI002415384C|nr:heavy metal translocating P-type ATPase [Roseibacterium sp. SDUM158017]MDG4647154.1 heavy metal translocating P-type ATPase [Roseibacterium sp. SDUM158017]
MPDTLQQHRLRYDIANLSCGGCAARARTALSAIPGVAEARVNFATRRADILPGPGFDPGAVGPAMEKAGYPATPHAPARPIRLEVANLSCGSCVARAEKALLNAPGVEEATVNLATRRAEIRTGGPFEMDALQSHMEAAGYPVRPLDDTPEAASATAPAERDEAAPYRRAFVISALLTLPVFVAEMGGHIVPALHHWLTMTFGQTPLRIAQFVLTTAVLAGPGAVFFRLGVPALLRRAPEMNSLVVLGAGAAWAWSTVVTFAPDLVPQSGRHVYFEAAAVIVTLILLGRWLEARARGQAGAAIAGLMALRPDTATRLRADGTEEDVPLERIRPGDLLRLRPGGRVAVDGVVEDGRSHVDEAMLTGEPLPVGKGEGDPVTAGTVNGTGALVYRATAVGSDTVLSRIVAMVEDAQATRLPVQSLIDRVTAVFVPVVLAIALVAGGLWLAFGPDPSQALVVTVSVLIIACPCAMGLATPVSILAGTGRAARLGVLFRQGDALQTLSRVDLVAFDKTGTLTEGRPAVTGLHPVAIAEAELLALAAAGERASEHPLARAIVEEAEARDLDVPHADGFQSVTGSGISASLAGSPLLVGSAAHLEAAGVRVPAPPPGPETNVHVARGGRYLGRIALSDPLKPDAARAVAGLMRRGIAVAILSGDGEGPVRAAAETLGVTEARHALSPGDKRATLDAWRDEGLKVAFVGDGINDAPILAAADVGIALGSGTDVAIEAADVVLVSGAPSAVVTAHEVSRRTLRNIAQNLVWAFGYNVALIPVAAGVLALAGGPFLNPMLAAGAMAASSVLVVANALRLKRMRAA